MQRLHVAAIVVLAWPTVALCQSQVPCGGELRNKIDEKQLALQYGGSELIATLGPLSFMGARMTVAPKTLQTASAATQQWNEYLKGLAAGWNACAITKEQYAEALQKLYPGLKDDGSAIEKIRQELAANRRIDEKRLSVLLDSYTAKLQRFAEITGNERLFRGMEAVTREVQGTRADISQSRVEQQQSFADIQAKLEEISRSIQATPKPEAVSVKISALKTKLLARADEAEAEYNRGYENLNQFRVADAILHFERAYQIISLPEFSLALGTALRLLPDSAGAEKVLAGALPGTFSLSDEGTEFESDLRGQLGLTLRDQGKLEGAQKQTERALAIDEKVYGPGHPTVAIRANNLGTILQDKGDLDGAWKQTERALPIDENVYGSDHPTVAIRASNLGLILQAKGDLEGAQK